MDVTSDIVGLPQIMDFIGDFKRPFTEGSAVLKANHIVECGVVSECGDTVEFFALCLQTSSLDSPPHEITTKIDKGEIIECSCTCKAGTGKCKHVTAFLLLLNRITALEDLKRISCTDLRQSWGKLKKTCKEMYESKPVASFCHFKEPPLLYKDVVMADISERMKEERRNDVLSCCSGSALAIHEAERATSKHQKSEELCTKLLGSSNSMYAEVRDEFFFLLQARSQEEKDFFEDKVAVTISEAVGIALRTHQQASSKEWLKQRQLRITGSTAYSLFTYGSGQGPVDWPNKISKIVWPKFAGNFATKYGQKSEGQAIAAYAAKVGCRVHRLGFMCTPNLPWLGFSPDGIAEFEMNGYFRLLEVKSPLAGREKSIEEVLPSLDYLNFKDGNYSLKQKHAYYAQTQIGMLITNTSDCDFVVYCGKDKDVFIIKIIFDLEFTKKMLIKLGHVYLEHYLPFLVGNKTQF